MRVLLLIVAFLTGAACGLVGGAMFGNVGWRYPLRGDKFEAVKAGSPVADLAGLSTSELGGELMRRVGQRFVHREGDSLEHGAVFYDEPKAYGQWLCDTNRYRITAKIVFPQTIHDRYWYDDLEMTQSFGVWRRPSQPIPPGLTREAACAKFRDFERVFEQRGEGTASRAIYLLDHALDAARADRVKFQLSCTDSRAPFNGRRCDGLAALKAMDLRHVRLVSNSTAQEGARSTARSDQIELDIPATKDPDRAWIVIRSVQRYGEHSSDEGDVVSVEIGYYAIH